MSDTSEQITQVRDLLAYMVILCEGARPDEWCGPGPERPWAQRIDTDDTPEGGPDAAALFIAAVSPDLMTRLVAHAEDVLDRHSSEDHVEWCWASFPCPEVAAVIKAWST